MKKNSTPIVLFLLHCCFYSISSYSQVHDAKLEKIYNGVLSGYLSIFTAIDEGRGFLIDRDKFAGHFSTVEAVSIDNDFENNTAYRPSFDNAFDYLDKITETFNNTNATINLDIRVEQRKEKMLFCKRNNTYIVWYTKTIRYGSIDNMTIIDNWTRVTIKEQSASVFKITEIKIGEKPMDTDGDQIVDICDDCRNTPSQKLVTIKGCDNDDIDEDKVPDAIDRCPTVFGQKSAHGCPDNDFDGVEDDIDNCDLKKGPASNKGCPISELNIGVSGGANMPFGTPYTNNRVLDNQTYIWTNNGNFAKWGLMFDVSLQYHFSTWLGFEVGCMDFSNRFDAKGLQSNVETFLGRNGIAYNNVAVNADAYRFFLTYFKLSMGNFSGENNVVKLQPMIGQAFKGFASNEVLTRINYASGNAQASALSFKSEPFLMFGSSLRYEYWFSDSRFALAMNLYYLTGTTKFTYQEVKFANQPNTLQFSNTRMQLGGATIGLQFNLAKGEQHYKGLF